MIIFYIKINKKNTLYKKVNRILSIYIILLIKIKIKIKIALLTIL